MNQVKVNTIRTEAKIARALLQFIRQELAKGGVFYIKYPNRDNVEVVKFNLETDD